MKNIGLLHNMLHDDDDDNNNVINKNIHHPWLAMYM